MVSDPCKNSWRYTCEFLEKSFMDTSLQFLRETLGGFLRARSKALFLLNHDEFRVKSLIFSVHRLRTVLSIRGITCFLKELNSKQVPSNVSFASTVMLVADTDEDCKR